jgi:hypothetical protein
VGGFGYGFRVFGFMGHLARALELVRCILIPSEWIITSIVFFFSFLFPQSLSLVFK